MVILTSLTFTLFTTGKANIENRAEGLAFDVSESKQMVRTDHGKMPLLFEANQGQTDPEAAFVARGPGYTLYMTAAEAVFQLRVPGEEALTKSEDLKHTKTESRSERLKMQFVGANPTPAMDGADRSATKTNYYIGRKKYENVPSYERVNYHGLYQGVDAVFYGNDVHQLEYDYRIAPNADVDQIRLAFDGARSVTVNGQGDLVLKTENTEMVQQKPVAFQTIDGERRNVEIAYVVSDQGQVGFAIGDYDRAQTLTIDPALSYLTYIGGTAVDNARDIAVDTAGNAYITGQVASLNFHGQTRDGGDGSGAYVARINEAGTGFDYVTILEGTGDDEGFGVAVDATGHAYVTGIASRYFPTTSGAFDTVHGVLNEEDAFVTKLDNAGEIVYSSFLGGTDQDEGADIAVDPSGKAYVVGNTYSNSAFPLKNKYQNCGVFSPFQTFDSLDAFLTVFNASGSGITYSSCIGNTVGVVDLSDEQAVSVALDASNNAYVTGETNSDNFKVKNAAQPEIGGGIDAFVAKFVPTQSGDASVAYATFLGGAGTDKGLGIAVDSGGQAHVTGITGSPASTFPLVNAFDPTNVINEAFLSRYSASGALNFSSFLGGTNQEEGDNIAVDNRGSVYVCGNTSSDDFPLALPFQAVRAGARDAFVTKIRIGTGVISSTLLGGSGNDKAFGVAVLGNHMFIAGPTESNNLQTTPGVIKATSNASATNTDGFVARILDTRLDSIGVFRPNVIFQVSQSTTNIIAQTLPFTTSLSGARGVAGDFNGDGIDTTGSFTNGAWKVRNVNFPILNFPATAFNFGVAGDLPIVGDWDGDGVDTAGTYRPSSGQFFLTNTANAQAVNATITFGIAEDLPVAGDWDGDGIDTVGVFRPSTGQFFLTNENIANPPIDFTVFFGTNGDLPLAGDFDGNGTDTIGVWRPTTAQFFLSNDDINIARTFVFGAVNTDQPIVGDWDGRPLP